jgi:hypothetical protein
MHVQREGAETPSGLGSQLVKQPAADAAPPSAFCDGHRHLRKDLAAFVANQRRLVKVPPGAPKALPTIASRYQSQIRRSGQQAADSLIVWNRQRPIIQATCQDSHLDHEITIAPLRSADLHEATLRRTRSTRSPTPAVCPCSVLLLDGNGSLLASISGALG